MNKLASTWRMGHFVGIKEGTDEAYVGTEQGAMMARSVKRLPDAMRKSPETLLQVRGVPWKMMAETAGTGERSTVQIERPEPTEGLPAPVVPDPGGAVQSRQMYVTKAMVEKFAMTNGCTACMRVVIHGTTNVAHSAVCRARMQDRLQGDKSRADLAQDKREGASKRPVPLETTMSQGQ